MHGGRFRPPMLRAVGKNAEPGEELTGTSAGREKEGLTGRRMLSQHTPSQIGTPLLACLSFFSCCTCILMLLLPLLRCLVCSGGTQEYPALLQYSCDLQ